MKLALAALLAVCATAHADDFAAGARKVDAVLEVSRAPVMASHSSCRALDAS